MSITLRDQFYGCIAGGFIGSAMGAVVEGMRWQDIDAQYGTIESFYGYAHNQSEWKREAGTTEAGVERQKLMMEAAILKGGRPFVEDVRKAWLQHLNAEHMKESLEPYDIGLYEIAKTSVPARDIGKYCDYSSLISFSGACQPIGLMNAGNPETAKHDVLDVGQLYQVSNSRGIRWAILVGTAIAEATRPGATLESILALVYGNCDAFMLSEVKRHLEATAAMRDAHEMREYFDQTYNGDGIQYVYASANEIVTKALCIFQMHQTDAKQAIVAGVNMGRGAAATASVAGSFAGAFGGAGSIPADWAERVDRATLANPYTCAKRTVRESSDALYAAFLAGLDKQQAFVDEMDIA